jgi:hypothetical protein
MQRGDVVLVLLFVTAVVVASLTSPRGTLTPPRTAGGWLVAADLHVHAFPGDGSLAPRELRSEAARRKLHVIAITNHNHMAQRRITPSSSGLPLVLTGEEVTMPEAHVLSLGLRRLVPGQGGARAAIDTVVARGGVAILAHPKRGVAARLGDEAMARLHGIEVANGPDFDVAGSTGVPLYRQLRERSPLAAIGSSDLHLGAPLGSQRTILLVSELSERGVLDAIRQGRTAVRFAASWVGDSSVIRATQPHVAALFDDKRRSTRPALIVSCVVAWLALLLLVLRN